MKLATVIRITRLPQALLLLLGAVPFCGLAILGEAYAWFADRPDITFALILVPWWLGTILNRISLAHLHRPAVLTLPHLTRHIVFLHGALTLAAATAFAGIARWGNTPVPYPIAVLLSLLFLNLPILSARPLVWMGSRTLGILIAAVVLLAGFIENSWFGVLVMHPGGGALLLLGLIIALYRKLLSRDHLRLRAREPNLNLLAGDDRQDEVQRQLDLRPAKGAASWSRRQLLPHPREFVDALAFEHLRGRGLPLALRAGALAFSAVIAVTMLYVVFNAPADDVSYPHALLQACSAFVWGLPDNPFPAYLGGLMLVVFTSVVAQFFPQFVRPALYPIPRQQLARAVLHFNTTCVLQWHAGFAIMVLTVSLIAAALDPVSLGRLRLPPVTGGFLLSLAVSWILLAGRVLTAGWTHVLARLLLLIATALLMLLPVLAVIWHEAALSPAGLTLLLAANALAWTGYASALRRHYRVNDLTTHQVGREYQTT